VAERVRLIRDRMRAAQARSPVATQPRPIVLVAATKGAPVNQILEAIGAGVDAIGENRLQELVEKCGTWRPTVPCHFIGRLQRNKVRLALQWCDMIESVDSLPLAEAIHARHLESGPRDGSSTPSRGRSILVQVNVAGEVTKGGFEPEALEAAIERMASWPGLAVEGLMAIPPYASDPEAARPHFRKVRALAERCSHYVSVLPNAGMPENVDGKAVYKLSPDDLADALGEFVERFGVDLVGGCCGTTPAHMKKVVERLRAISAPRRARPRPGSELSSAMKAVPMTLEPRPLLVGERLNSQGSRKVKELLLADDYPGLLQIARGQVEAGAHVLDVCVALNERDDEGAQMRALVKLLAQAVDAPLMIDSTEPDVIESALAAASSTPSTWRRAASG